MTGRMKTLGAGLLAGLVAALLMTLMMVVLRYTLGVASTFEMIGDRFAPLIPVKPFLDLQATLGGYNQMKQLGVSSAIIGQLVVGSLGGAAYAIIVGRAGRSEGEGRRFGRPGVTFVAGAVGVAWLAILALLWPVLDTNFRGLPPGTARVVTALGLLFLRRLRDRPRPHLPLHNQSRADGPGGRVGDAQGRTARLSGLRRRGSPGARLGGAVSPAVQPGDVQLRRVAGRRGGQAGTRDHAERRVLRGHQERRGPAREPGGLAIQHKRHGGEPAHLRLRGDSGAAKRGPGDNPLVYQQPGRRQADEQRHVAGRAVAGPARRRGTR
jgi:hypothetical protein